MAESLLDEDLAKSHIKGYTKKDGQYVKPHERGGMPTHPNAKPHPQMDHTGKPVTIKRPSHESAPSTWHNPDSVATFIPDGDVPLSINGVRLSKWKDHPKTTEGWNFVDGVNDDLEEPDFHVPNGKHASSGVIVEEPDGRVWLIAPTNQFGGYEASFPKGTTEEGLSMQGNAIKEAFEESGLKVQITGFIGDFERTTSVCRMYRAKRIGGTPIAMGWETQAVHLVPKGHLYEHLNMWPDHPIAEMIGGGPAPKKPAPPVWGKPFSQFDKKKT